MCGSAANTTRVLRQAAGLLLAVVAAAPPAIPVRAQGNDTLVVRARWLMGAPCEVRAFGVEREVGPVLDRALDRIEQLEQALTTWRPDGELAQLNVRCAAPEAAAAPLPVSPDLARALALARGFAERTAGAFDPSVEPLLVAWGAKTGGRVPTPKELRAAMARTGWARFEVSLKPPAVACGAVHSAFDLGAIGKGIALDEAAAMLRAQGVTRALFNFGGQVLVLDPPPGREGWIVDVAGPADRTRAARTRTLARTSLAVSGNSERAIEIGGRRRGHVIDPRTGEPIDRTAALVVIAPTAAAADALSTALFVLGPGPEAEAAASASGATFEFLPMEVPDVR